MERLARGRVLHHALEVAGIQQAVHGGELEVAGLLETPLAALQGLAVVQPAVGDVGRVADLAAEHGTAAVQCILGLGLLGELDRGGGRGQSCGRGGGRERGVEGGQGGRGGEGEGRMGIEMIRL